ncbi:MAG: isoprenylcysteine carboxylmethyltransferase family protein [Anaerolineales bacterium]|nr:isoprenylcysteine carboxylmethyltransferase family protein [Anaerolineales bacterium]
MIAGEFLFRMLFILSFCLVLLIRLYFGFRLKKERWSSWQVDEQAVAREGTAIIALRLAGFLLLLGAFVLYIDDPAWQQILKIPFPAWVRTAGALLALVSILLLAWTHAALGRHWSTNLTIQEKHTLVTNGPYRFVRHPMYTALIGYFIGAGLLSAHLLLLLIFAAATVFLLTRTGREEAMMIESFGEAYLVYREHTGLLLPWLKR